MALTHGRIFSIEFGGERNVLWIAAEGQRLPITVHRNDITAEDTDGKPVGFLEVGTEIVFRLDTTDCGHPVIFPSWVQVTRPGDYVENLPMITFRQAHKDRKLMKRYVRERFQRHIVNPTADLREFLAACFHANAIRGQLIMVFLGALFGGLIGREASQLVTDTLGTAVTRPEGLGIATVVFTLLVVPPFVLPVRAMDRRTEMTPLWILTFIPSLGLGIILGVMFLLYGAWAIIPAGFFSTCYAVAAAFWYVSQLSRNFQYQVIQQSGVLGRYPTLGDLTYLVKSAGEHGATDDLLRSIHAFQEKELIRSWTKVMLAVDMFCTIAGLPGIRARKNLLEEIRKILRLTEEEAQISAPAECHSCTSSRAQAA